ncbi:PREDICTED: uncharacterized protein LOC108560755 [Nicrophorus vespilloides]|uniref:Uncharacterized protein LOC108560755 n=1 Tax=Nicrophorus vespilloides TaxID=110193 RepID=A0ABM1MH76_NICVS|nr:PREDICTED: uncharacterized protein LOC108560755 [Nicrophorus vespilloides]
MFTPTVLIFSAILTFQLGAATFQQDCESGHVDVAMEIFTKVKGKWQGSVQHLVDAKTEVFDKVKQCKVGKTNHKQLVELQEKFAADMTKCNEKLVHENGTIHKEMEKINKLLKDMKCSKDVVTTKSPAAHFQGAVQHLRNFFAALKNWKHGLKQLPAKHVSLDKPWLKLLQTVVKSISHLMSSLVGPSSGRFSCSKHGNSDCKKVVGHINKIVGAVTKSTTSYDACIKKQKDLLYKDPTYTVLCQ